MSITRKTLVTVIATGFLAAACAPAKNRDDVMTPGEMIGTGIGTVIGGLIGWQYVGAGQGRMLASGIGAFVGSGVGYYVGKGLTESDKRKAEATAQRALAFAGNGETRSWHNEESGHSGQFTAGRGFQDEQGRSCRNFRLNFDYVYRQEKAEGSACQGGDGNWSFAAI